jgi:hypothetical protein
MISNSGDSYSFDFIITRGDCSFEDGVSKALRRLKSSIEKDPILF